jgi:MFS family permease
VAYTVLGNMTLPIHRRNPHQEDAQGSGAIGPLGLLVAARLIGQTGDRFTLLALPLFAVSEAGGTTAQVALLFTIYALPGVGAALLGRPFDRSSRLRSWCVGADLLRGLLMVALVLLTARTGPNWLLVVAVTLACGCCGVVFDIGLQAYLPRAVPAAHLGRTNSWFARAQAFADVLGPPAAGAVVAGAGPATAITINAISFTVSGVLLLLVCEKPASQIAHKVDERLFREWAAGVHYLLADRLLASMTATMLLLNLGGSVIGALWVVHVTQALHVPPDVLGMITAVGGMSALAGSLIVGVLLKCATARWCVVGAFVIAIVALWCIPGAALGSPLLLLSIYQMLFSASAVMVAVGAATIRQLRTPAHLQARVFSVIRTCQNVILPVGGVVAALVTASAGTQVAVLIGAVAATGALPAVVSIARSTATDIKPDKPMTAI